MSGDNEKLIICRLNTLEKQNEDILEVLNKISVLISKQEHLEKTVQTLENRVGTLQKAG
jgi:chaperonin cofactor prefoldin